MNNDITPRERVLLSLGHMETDRLPVDFHATPEVWKVLKEFLGLKLDESVMRMLGVDIRHPQLTYIGPKLKKFPDGSYTDAWGITWSPVKYKEGTYYEISKRPFENIHDVDEIKNYNWPNPDWWDINSLKNQIQRFDNETEYAICLDFFGDPGGFYEIANYMRGMEQYMIDMAMNIELANEIIRKVTDFFILLAEKILSALGSRIDLVWTSDDIAHQHGLMMSIPMWKQIIFPHHARFNKRVHEMGSRIMYHSCGSVYDALPGLVEMGIDVLDVLQFSADNMVPEKIKLNFGNKLCFHGGIDVQHLLPQSSPEEIRREVKRISTVMGKNGGFILSPSHAIQIDTKPENIIAIYEEAGSLVDTIKAE